MRMKHRLVLPLVAWSLAIVSAARAEGPPQSASGGSPVAAAPAAVPAGDARITRSLLVLSDGERSEVAARPTRDVLSAVLKGTSVEELIALGRRTAALPGIYGAPLTK